MARTYNQDCILAHTLDVLGERWTLLIVRELLLGPMRFGDLQAGLPGIGANLLSKRLKDLESAGLTTAPSAEEPRGVYRLSSEGEALRPVIMSMVFWGIKYFFLRPERGPANVMLHSNDLKPDSVALAIELFARCVVESDLNYVAHVYLDEQPYTFYYMNGTMTARRGCDGPAVATVRTDVETCLKGFRDELTPAQLKKKVDCTGETKASGHIFDIIAHIDEESRAKLIA